MSVVAAMASLPSLEPLSARVRAYLKTGFKYVHTYIINILLYVSLKTYAHKHT